MNKLSNFIVKKRIPIFIAFLLLTLGSALLLNGVNINYDMTKYLPNASGTKKGTELMNKEFKESTSINVMFHGLSTEEKTAISKELTNLNNVNRVTYDAEDAQYSKSGYALYAVNIPGNSYSDEAMDVLNSIKDKYSEHEIYMSGPVVNTANENASLSKIIIMAAVILTIILFIMSSSWLEPFLFLFVIALAVVMNMGTNVIFPYVSSTTHSIAAILQVVLSMDYSIMLIDRYRQEKKLATDKENAMIKTISHGFLSIASSSVTTIVGLLCLIFMSFTIGKDMGLVLAKGVFISLLCILFVLPALTLFFDKQIEATRKKVPTFKMNLLGCFSNKFRHLILAAFLLIFVGAYFLQGNLDIIYTAAATTSDSVKIEKVFPSNNPIIVLYENKEEENIRGLISEIETMDGVDNINGYGNTIGKKYTTSQLAETMDIDETVIKLLIYDYFNYGETDNITLADFLKFLNKDVATNALFSDYFDKAILTQLNQLSALTDINTIKAPLPAAQLAAMLHMDEKTVSDMMTLYYGMKGKENKGTISLEDFVNFLVNDVATNKQYAAAFDKAAFKQIKTVQRIVNAVVEEKEFAPEELIPVLDIAPEMLNEDTLELLYMFYFSQKDTNSSSEISMYDFMNFMIKDVLKDDRFARYFTDEIKTQITDASEQMEDVKSSLVGKNYSRLIINTSFGPETEAVYALIDNLKQQLSDHCDAYYIVGNSPLAYEMHRTFQSEFRKISLITAISIFVVVAVTFRSIIIPFILVLLIQSSVYITMGITSMQGESMHYLSLIIVQAILMGATIDYAILYTSYYRTRRIANKEDVKEATKNAYKGSIMTIMTSASILVVITLVVGIIMSEPTISQVCLTIAKGSFIAIVMVILILPGVLASLDRFVCRSHTQRRLCWRGDF